VAGPGQPFEQIEAPASVLDAHQRFVFRNQILCERGLQAFGRAEPPLQIRMVVETERNFKQKNETAFQYDG